jgi:hypothetical protein
MRQLTLLCAGILALSLSARASDFPNLAGSTSRTLAIYEQAIRDAKAMEQEAKKDTEYHRPYKLTEEEAVAFLASPDAQAVLLRNYPDPNDRIAYQYAFVMFIRFEIARSIDP